MDDAGHRRWRGGLFARELEGRQPAWISFSSDSIVAETEDGILRSVAAVEASLEIGGASGHMLFVHNPDRSLTLYCEDRGFLQALEREGPTALKPDFERLAASRSRRRTVGWVVFTAVVALLALAAVMGPGILRTLAAGAIEALPMSVDEKIGKAALSGMDLGGPEVTDSAALAALQQMLDRLGPHVARKDVRFRIHLVRNPQLNAFALPGGEIVVYTGLIAEAETAEQVAGVLAHEQTHVTRRHGLKRIVESLGIVAAVQLIFGDVGGLLAVGTELFTLAAVNSYSREHENEADAEAVELMARAGLDPRAIAGFFRRIKKDEGSLPAALSWLSTHPDTDARIAAVEERARIATIQDARPLDLDWQAIRSSVGAVPADNQDKNASAPVYPKEGTKP